MESAAKVGMAVAEGAFTTSVTGTDELLPANVALALKLAESVCVPVLNEAVLKLAVPSAWSDAVPNGTLPAKNVTPPNGVPDMEETDALMVTTVPAVVELLDTDAVVAVGKVLTVTVTGTEVLCGKICAALENP